MSICETLRAGVGELFQCENAGGYLRIRMPYLYPDGDYIDVFVKEQGDELTITDLGETTRWLRMQTVAMRRSPKQRQLIKDACLTHGLEFYQGMLLARCSADEKNLSATVTRVAQGALCVSDLWFTFRTRAFESVTDEVADFLTIREAPFQRGEQLTGPSGRPYTIDFHARVPQSSSLVAVLSTGSRSAAPRLVDHITATWYDLSHLKVGQEPVEFVSLFDDTLNVWRDEEFRLVEDFSKVAYWSAQEEFVQMLRAA